MSWNDLSEREKSLDRKITSYLTDRNIEINTSNYLEYYNLDNETIEQYMCITGAEPNERDFIIKRIESRMRAYKAMQNADNCIERTESMLEEFNKSDELWKEKLKEFGIDFGDSKNP